MVAMMRDLGHDCLHSAAIPPSMPDVDVLRMAASDQQIRRDIRQRLRRVGIHSQDRMSPRRAVPRCAGRRKRPGRSRSVPVANGALCLPGSFVTITASGVGARPILEGRDVLNGEPQPTSKPSPLHKR